MPIEIVSNKDKQENITIQDIPLLPKGLKEAIENKKLVIFLGAGFSRLFGCESWSRLAKDLIETCKKHTDIEFSVQEVTNCKNNDNKKLITAAYFMLDKIGLKKEFYKVLLDAIRPNPEKNDTEFLRNLRQIGNLFVTTNADKIMDSYFAPENIINNFKTKIIPEPHKLYHIHGTVDNLDDIIFITTKYIERYNDENFKDFISELFKNYTVLFLGYGLSEFELIDYILLKTNVELQNINTHYTLLGYNNKTQFQYCIDSEYFSSLKIDIIPYNDKQNGYSRKDEGFSYQKDIIKEWNRIVFEDTKLVSQNQLELEKYLRNEYQIKKHKAAILTIINEFDAQLRYFIKKCTINNKLSNLFIEDLYNQGLFNLKSELKPGIKDGYNYTPSWIMSDFINAYGNYISTSHYYKKITFLLNIINNVFTADNEYYRNYKIIKPIIDVIFKIPLKYFDSSWIETIRNLLEIEKTNLIVSLSITNNLSYILKLNVEDLNNFLLIIFDLKKVKDDDENKNNQPLLAPVAIEIIVRNYFNKILKKINWKGMLNLLEKLIKKINPIYSLENIYLKTNLEYRRGDDFLQLLINMFLFTIYKQSPKKRNEYLLSKNYNSNSLLGKLAVKIKNNKIIKISTNSVKNYVDDSSIDFGEQNSITNIDIIQSIINEKNNIKRMSLYRPLHNDVLNNPNKYLDSIFEYIELPSDFIYQIVSAFYSLLSDKKYPFSKNDNFINFLLSYLSKEEIWCKEDYNNICIKEIFDFVSTYFEMSDISYIKENYDNLRNIIINNYDKVKQIICTEEYSKKDYAMIYLNNLYGKYIKCLFSFYVYSVNYVPINKRYNFTTIFDKELNSSTSNNIEFIIGVGENLIDLFHVDYKWVDDNFLNIVNKYEEEKMVALFIGFFFNSRNRNISLMEYLNNKSLFIKMLDFDFSNTIWCSSFISLFCSIYFFDKQNVINGKEIIFNIINSKNFELNKTMITSIYNGRDELLDNPDTDEKIYEIWNNILLTLKDSQSNESYEVRERLLDLLCCINKIDDKMVMLIIDTLSEKYNYFIDSVFVEQLLRFFSEQENKKNVTSLIQLLIDNKIQFYDYDDKLIELFKEICNYDLEAGIRVCNTYSNLTTDTKYTSILMDF